MRNIVFGFVLGSFVSAGIALFFGDFLGGVLGATGHRQLIVEWRRIQPGMTVDEVKLELGEANGTFAIGDEFPEWALRSVPADYFTNHGLMTYVIPSIAPQVLLIYYDEHQRVVFVSSVPT